MHRWLAHALLLLLISGATSARFVHEFAAHGGDGCRADHRHAGFCLGQEAQKCAITAGIDGQEKLASPEQPCRDDRSSCRTCELLAISIAGAPSDIMVAEPIGGVADWTAVEHERNHAIRTANALRARPPPLS